MSVTDGRVRLRDPGRLSGTKNRRRRSPCPSLNCFPSKLHAPLRADEDLGGTLKAIKEFPSAELQLLDHRPLSPRTNLEREMPRTEGRVRVGVSLPAELASHS